MHGIVVLRGEGREPFKEKDMATLGSKKMGKDRAKMFRNHLSELLGNVGIRVDFSRGKKGIMKDENGNYGVAVKGEGKAMVIWEWTG